MERVAVFVDAGYLFTQGAETALGKKLGRGQIALDRGVVLKLLTDLAESVSGVRLLRIYWYDGTDRGPTAAQVAIAEEPNVKLRLGVVNSYGQQKGVDSLIVTDMINLSRNKAISDALLLTGDEDLRVGVQQAQEFGVRVHLLGFAPGARNQSDLLRQEADTLEEFSKDVVASFISESSGKIRLTRGVTDLKRLAGEFASLLTSDELASVLVAQQIPVDIDRRLLPAVADCLGRDLEQPEKRTLREALKAAAKAPRK